MKRIEINVNGTAYPCGPTMGAMLRFKEQTGREITDIDPQSFTDLCTYLWCCTVSASKREGKPFDMPLMEFADSITPDDMAAWNRAMQVPASDNDATNGEKKRP